MLFRQRRSGDAGRSTNLRLSSSTHGIPPTRSDPSQSSSDSTSAAPRPTRPCSTTMERSSSIGWSRRRVGSARGPTPHSKRSAKCSQLVLHAAGVSADAVRAIGLDTPGPASGHRCDRQTWRHQLLPAGMVGFRLPNGRRTRSRPAGDLQQRRQRGGVVRPRPAVRRRCRSAFLGVGDRRHRSRWRRHRDWVK